MEDWMEIALGVVALIAIGVVITGAAYAVCPAAIMTESMLEAAESFA